MESNKQKKTKMTIKQARRATHALNGQHESLGRLLQPGTGHSRIRCIHDPFPCRFTALLEPQA